MATETLAGNQTVTAGGTIAVTPAVPPDIYLGVVFELNGTEIGLEPTTPINKVAQYGLECQLPGPVPLGEIGENLKTVLEELGADPSIIFDETTGQVKKELADLPFIGNLIALIFDADITVEEFYLKIPPSPPVPNPPPSNASPAVKPPTEPNLYSVGLSAVWDTEGGEGKIIGNLSLKGLYVKVSNLDTAKKATPDDKQLPAAPDTEPNPTDPPNNGN